VLSEEMRKGAEHAKFVRAGRLIAATVYSLKAAMVRIHTERGILRCTQSNRSVVPRADIVTDFHFEHEKQIFILLLNGQSLQLL